MEQLQSRPGTVDMNRASQWNVEGPQLQPAYKLVLPRQYNSQHQSDKLADGMDLTTERMEGDVLHMPEININLQSIFQSGFMTNVRLVERQTK